MNARVYDPGTGRFLSPDPVVQSLHDGQAHNRYAYARNNPLRYVDPSGHFFGWIGKAVDFVVDFAVDLAVDLAVNAATNALAHGLTLIGVPPPLAHALATAAAASLGGGGTADAVTAGIFTGVAAGTGGAPPYPVSRGGLGGAAAAAVLGRAPWNPGGDKFDNGASSAAFAFMLNRKGDHAAEDADFEEDCHELGGNRRSPCTLRNAAVKAALTALARAIRKDKDKIFTGPLVVTGGDSRMGEDGKTVYSRSTKKPIGKRKATSPHNDCNGSRGADVRTGEFGLQTADWSVAAKDKLEMLSGGNFIVYIKDGLTDEAGRYLSDGHIHLTCVSDACMDAGDAIREKHGCPGPA